MAFIIAGCVLVAGWFGLLHASKVRRRRWLGARSTRGDTTPTMDSGPSSDFGDVGFDGGDCGDSGDSGTDSSCD